MAALTRSGEGERDRHVNLPYAAASHWAMLGVNRGVRGKLLEPAAPPRNRCDKERTVLRPDRAGAFTRDGFGYEDLTTSDDSCLVPGHK